MKKKVILPFEDHPYSLMYQGGAFPAGIIQANAKEDITPWLSSRYINCWFDPKVANKFSYYLSENWPAAEGILLQQRINLFPGLLEKLFHEELFDLSKRMMDQGWYPHGNFNEEYIPGKAAYQKRRYGHDFMLIGYDDFEEVYFSVGYLGDGHFQKFPIPYENMKQSIQTLKHAKPVFNFWKLNPNAQFSFNLDKIILELSEYLDSTTSNEMYKYDRTWGIESLRVLGNHMLPLCKNQERIDLRYPRGLMEYKEYMKIRIEYLLQRGYLSKQNYLKNAEQVFQLAKNIHMLSIKYMLTGNVALGDRIYALIEQIIAKELEYLPNVLAELKSKQGEITV